MHSEITDVTGESQVEMYIECSEKVEGKVSQDIEHHH